MYGRAGFVPLGRQGTVLSVSQGASPARLWSPACSPPIRPFFFHPQMTTEEIWGEGKRRNRRRGACLLLPVSPLSSILVSCLWVAIRYWVWKEEECLTQNAHLTFNMSACGSSEPDCLIPREHEPTLTHLETAAPSEF